MRGFFRDNIEIGDVVVFDISKTEKAVAGLVQGIGSSGLCVLYADKTGILHVIMKHPKEVAILRKNKAK